MTLGAASAAAATVLEGPTAADAAVTAAPASMHMPKKKTSTAKVNPLTAQPEAYRYFTTPESAFVEAAIDRLIPSDHLGAGAREAGVAYFIDEQLEGQYGYAAKMYRQGPWGIATPTQGYQLALTPREVYRIGIRATQDYCQRTYRKPFEELSASHQDEVLSLLDDAKITFDDVPAKTFFEMLYENTIEGYFADPIYGGNRDKVGWKLVGFPGVAAAYIGVIERHNIPYVVDPVGISDENGSMAIAPSHTTVHQLAQNGTVR
jgi:gluconate 2-dehydrogenase gamma chain